ncbi:MAG TPA: hypothetical protein VFS07_06665 [Gemmatimonadales bacterium]|nr:hypothetical protein [Gemmatimonadales bacterium]
MQWHLLTDPPADGAANMARDVALLELAAERGMGFVRTYTWAPFTLSFGANEPALRRYDRDAIAARGMAAVRRPTGGRAVWHAEELTYAVAAPDPTFGPLPETYRRIHATLAQGLATLGAALAPSAPPAAATALDAGACFASPAGGELVAAAGKVVGSAQLRERGAFLQHGSILLGNRQERVTEVTRGDAPPAGAAHLSALLGRDVPAAEVAQAVALAVRAWPGEWREADAPLRAELDRRAAGQLARFQDPAWTWRR